ncbi:hypothetical protein [Vibrio phage JSF23]|jgi:hypothetical protein|uniref:Uncharacterized protein n=4 Tax=Icepovirus bengalense TaxID=2846603 RepID=A0A076G4Z6_9CAUD|nr:tail protein [Vibrio phage ICP2]ADX87764.1 hypothetical protein TU12-16_00050 [Vibrio phage ICP2_2006_A]AII27055.1 hypothetical protein ICP22011A_0011 [Vibrio phage ICP2_2011_A]ASV43778.1 hypothetical protein [Vibrio phage JSF23]ASV43804.1 hypothetical protein [Vibrio phage JSF27]ADX87693.1 conserved hypothetical protein [Vibrio phage ICP2]
MKYTVIDIVQDMLSDSDGDNVNSIDDTTESLQAAYILRSSYDNLITNSTIDYFRRGVQFDGVSDVDKPNYLKLPDNIQEMTYLAYDTSMKERPVSYTELKYLYPDEFLARQATLNSGQANVQKVRDYNGIVYFIQNDKAPQFWTSFDDEYLVLDSYNKDVESTIHKDKTQGIAYISPKFVMEDDWIIDLPADMFPYLISEAKAAFSAKIRQMDSAKDEQWATIHRRRMSRKSWQAKGGIRLPNYGRPTSSTSPNRRSPYFDKSY